jgi:hypothetical protein
MDKELIPWLTLAALIGGPAAIWLAKAWQRLRNGCSPRNPYSEYRRKVR